MSKKKYLYCREDWAVEFAADVLSSILSTFNFRDDVSQKLTECLNYMYDLQHAPDSNLWDYSDSYFVNRFVSRDKK